MLVAVGLFFPDEKKNKSEKNTVIWRLYWKNSPIFLWDSVYVGSKRGISRPPVWTFASGLLSEWLRKKTEVPSDPWIIRQLFLRYSRTPCWKKGVKGLVDVVFVALKRKGRKKKGVSLFFLSGYVVNVGKLLPEKRYYFTCGGYIFQRKVL